MEGSERAQDLMVMPTYGRGLVNSQKAWLVLLGTVIGGVFAALLVVLLCSIRTAAVPPAPQPSPPPSDPQR